jgi:thiamine-monophosphate kinase
LVTGKDPLELALSGGEDYRLMVTVDPHRATEITDLVARQTGRRLHDVGEIISGDHITLRQPTGETALLQPSGWNHFSAPDIESDG